MTLIGALTGVFIVLLTLAFLLWAFRKGLHNWKQRRDSLKWPMVPAHVTDSHIIAVDSGEGGESYRLLAHFGYIVQRQSFDGSYQERFGSEARQIERSLQNAPLFVWYNPADPSDHFLDPYRDMRLPD